MRNLKSLHTLCTRILTFCNSVTRQQRRTFDIRFAVINWNQMCAVVHKWEEIKLLVKQTILRSVSKSRKQGIE